MGVDNFRSLVTALCNVHNYYTTVFKERFCISRRQKLNVPYNQKPYVGALDKGGVGALELVAMDMKAR